MRAVDVTPGRQAMGVADLVEAVHEGRIGHAEAMARLNLSTFDQLVETVHLHGLAMWAHRPVKLEPATLDVLARACEQMGASDARPKKRKRHPEREPVV